MEIVAWFAFILGLAGVALAAPAVWWYRTDRKKLIGLAEQSLALAQEYRARIESMVPKTAEDWERIEVRIQPVVDRITLRAADTILQHVGPVIDERVEAYTKELGGMVSGTIGLMLEAMQHGKTHEKSNDAREAGLQVRRLKGFSNQAAREIAAELDPSGGVLSTKLLDLAERYDVSPEEALQLGMSILDKYPDLKDKLGPALKKGGAALKEKVSGTGAAASGGGGWG